MKITRQHLEEVIKEEISNLLQERPGDEATATPATATAMNQKAPSAGAGMKMTSDVTTAKKKLDTLPQLRRLLSKVDRRVEALEMLDIFLNMMSDKLDPKEIKRILQLKIQKM